MAYIGRDIQYGILDKQSFTANSSTTVFTLDSGVQSAKSLLVCVGGVIQEPEVAYTASGTTITFTSAPTTGSVVYAIYLGKELASSTGGRESITFQSGTGDGSDTTPLTLSAAPVNAQSLMVTLNGVTQVPVTDYTVSGTTLAFTTAPANGVAILVYHLGTAAAVGVIADNSVTNPKIVSMAASKLTGSLPAGMADTTAINQSISALGLHMAVADNKASFNLPNAFLDQFESDSGILTETTVDRDTTGEYVSSTSGTNIDSNTLLLVQSNTTNGSTTFSDDSSSNRAVTVTGPGTISHSTTQTNAGSTSLYFANATLDVPHDVVWNWDSSQSFTMECYQYLPVMETWSVFTHSTSGSWGGIGYGFGVHADGSLRLQTSSNSSAGTTANGTAGAVTANTWHHIAWVRHGGYFKGYVDGVENFSVSDFDPYDRTVAFQIGSDHQWSRLSSGYVDMIRVSNIARYTSNNFTPPTAEILGQSVNATGTLISTASTADATVSKASGVMLYTDASGTATLGTDLEVYFSADDGVNWTEASTYGTPITFAGTTKMVKLGDTTIANTGTTIKMKAVWANQAATTYGSQAQVAQGTGTAIGDMTQNGGLSAAFDGTTSQAATSVASLSVPQGQVSWIGKDWGNGVTKTITGFKHYASSDDGTSSNGANSSNCTITLYGSNTNNTATATSLGGLTGLSDFRTNSATHTKLSGLTETTAYRYHWLKFTTPSNGQIFAAEVEFYETPTGVTGKETRLNGWAVNY